MITQLAEILKAPDFSMDEINLGEQLDSMTFGDRQNFLNVSLQKLNPYGQITIGGLDIYAITRLISNNRLNLIQANEILANIKSMDSLNNVERFFYNNKFKNVYKNIENGKYVGTYKRI